jgi:hypothetical protein
MAERSRILIRAILLAAGATALVLAVAGPARAAVSPSGVNWGTRHVLALESDDIGNGEFNMSCSASTRYRLNRPWTGEQWTNIADAFRGHTDALGAQIPLTLYVVAAFMEPDFTPVASSSSLAFNESFSGALPSWTVFGSNPPTTTVAYYVSPAVSARFDTPTASADGWARRWVNECKEYELTFWYRLEGVDARTHLISVSGPLARTLGIEAQAPTGMLYLREGYYNDELLTPIGPYEINQWRRITFRVLGGRAQVDMDSNGTIELDKPAAFLPTLANQVLLGDPSTSIYSGRGNIDDLIFTRWDNTYPAVPQVTPIDVKFPGVVSALNADRSIFRVLCHGLTHGNNGEVQRRYAGGVIDDTSVPEENWWREDYDAVNDNPWGVLYQYDRLTQALDILERSFGVRSPVHVSPGNVYGHDTDAALAMAGVRYHETLTAGTGSVSSDEPEVFWTVRTTERELFFRQPDPNPQLSATLAVAQVDSLFAAGYPAVLQTHAFNALVDGNGAALALFYHRLLDTLAVRHPEIIALTMDEMASLERDGWSVGGVRANRIYARNYLAAVHEFHVVLPDSFTVQMVKRLPLGQPLVYRIESGDIVFSGGEGDYAIDLVPAAMSGVHGDGPGAPAGRGAIVVTPNPSRGRVSLAARIPSAGDVNLEILDLQGRRVRQLDRGPLAAGEREFSWDGTTADGRPAAPGLYFARLVWTGGLAQAKILLVP